MIALLAISSWAGDSIAGPADGLTQDTTVPISVESGQVVVNVTINSQGPFPMMIDTGAVVVVTPETASALGLDIGKGGTIRGAGEGTIPVSGAGIREMRVGEAELSDLHVPVVPLPRFFTDRGIRPPLAGLLGYELLAHFALRLDYQHKTVTLTPMGNFRYSGVGERIALLFAGKIPVISATVDGIAGRFEIDMGASNALVLQREFVDRSSISVRHPSTLRMKVGGIDGVFEIAATRLDSLQIGNNTIERPAAELPLNGSSGLPVADIDGSIGYQILRQFTITFDYARSELWLEPSAAFGAKTIQWKTGFQAIKADGPDFRVIHVAPNTPAAGAGIKVGDVITQIDGRPAASIGQAQFGDLMRGPDGTAVHLTLIRDGKSRRARLTLKELAL
jgi:predicted aspartyl protease